MVTRISDVHRDWLDTSGIPEIHLKGLYLEKMGFAVGTSVMIVVEKGRIVITPMDMEADYEK